MGIGGIGSASRVGGIEQVQSVDVSRPSSIPPGPADTSAATTNISKPGELLGKLQLLEQQDPAKFKEIVTGLAESLRKDASQAGASDSSWLNKLADRFDQVASTGNLSALEPTSQSQAQSAQGAGGAQHHHHGGHGHHGHGGSGSLASLFSNALDQVNQALGAGTSSSTDPQPTA